MVGSDSGKEGGGRHLWLGHRFAGGKPVERARLAIERRPWQRSVAGELHPDRVDAGGEILLLNRTGGGLNAIIALPR